MAKIVDPEGNETRALLELVDFEGQHVLEIGCGDGRLTWRYAHLARRVTAIDPSAEQIALAREQTPAALRDRLTFKSTPFEAFAAAHGPSSFDVAILSWSLC